LHLTQGPVLWASWFGVTSLSFLAAIAGAAGQRAICGPPHS
jgi:hypothetical protein